MARENEKASHFSHARRPRDPKKATLQSRSSEKGTYKVLLVLRGGRVTSLAVPYFHGNFRNREIANATLFPIAFLEICAHGNLIVVTVSLYCTTSGYLKIANVHHPLL